MSSSPDNFTLQLQLPKYARDLKSAVFIFLGLAVFTLIYALEPVADAIDPAGQHFPLSREGKAAIALFLLAGIWWIFEVIPVGITSITIGVIQALFFIRPAREVFRDFSDPSVLFVFGSLLIGMVFTKVGLTKRISYKMLSIVGDRTSMIYLGSFVLTAALTHFMAHTAVAATMFPILMAIHAMYSSDEHATRFGKGLFIGMAFVAGAGSMITLLGAARGAVAISFFEDIVGRSISFFELTFYMFPIGWLLVLFTWIMIMLMYKPEKKSIPGLKNKAKRLYREIGPLTHKEIFTICVLITVIVVLSLKSFIPAFVELDKAAVVLASTVVFFLFRILVLSDLEQVPWNIMLLFAGAMSMGFCLWETGAAHWMAVKWLILFQQANWFLFILGIAFFVLIMTNFIMNVAAIAITLPVSLVIAPYLGVAPEVVLYTSLAVAACPFLLLVGAAPNAIAYGSKQFSTLQFLAAGIPASLILFLLVAFAVAVVWPMMGMPITDTL